MKLNRPRLAVAAAMATFALTSCGFASESGSDGGPVVWTWDHGLSLPGTAYEELMTEDLAAMIEEATDGAVTIELTIGQTDPAETVAAIQSGRFDGGTVVTTSYAGTYPLWTFGEVGFLINDYDEWEEAQRGEAGDFVREAFEEDTGLVQVGGAVPWASAYVFTDEPLTDLEDWEGLRLRAASIESSNLINALGGSAVSMPFGELYTALDRGVVDGFQTSQNAALALSPWEVVDYVNTWPAGIGYVYPTVSPDALDGLDDETRDKVLAAFDEFQDLAWEKARADEVRTQDVMTENGMQVVQPDAQVLERARAGIGQALLDDWASRTGPQAETLLSLLGK